ncbi:cysteinyl-trna synthetase [Holotrichia oblita]|nr:cysteinyl-trna synthetase [Holotrichia oblita]
MLKLYNTLNRRKEDFKPIGAEVTMYSCGPTVYKYAHIGNMRAYIFMDTIRRVLAYDNFKIKGVMNITDVGHLMSDSDDGEDKIIKASKEQQKSPYEIAKINTDAFMCDSSKLNIGTPELVVKATDHIQEMIDFVYDLQKKGYAYETSDGIYFDISKFDGYGKLSGIKIDELIAGARVEINTEKRHPADFALWKKAPKEHIMQWESPWGMGYPGWHIECSAMSQKYLGDTFDIHTGGIDHIPVHHENEIAQSEAKTGKKMVNYWLHCEFMMIDGGKMSKSLGNAYTVHDLEKMSYSPLAFRYFCLNTHYRKALNFTMSGLDGAQTAYKRLLAQTYEHKKSTQTTETTVIKGYEEQFQKAIDDDLNIPLALGIAWTALKEPASRDIYTMLVNFDMVLGLDLHKAAPIQDTANSKDIPKEVTILAELRLTARQNKNWAESDKLRMEITNLGYTVVDSKDGYTIKKN